MGELRDFASIAPDLDEGTVDGSPILKCLGDVYARFRLENSGSVATYIPELAKADPDLFGICLATTRWPRLRGRRHRQPFTIQSISKPFVYGLALEDHGRDPVLRGSASSPPAKPSIPSSSTTQQPAVQPDGQCRRHRTHRAGPRRRPRTAGRPDASALLCALRRAPARGRRGGLSIREADRPPQPRHRLLERNFGMIDERVDEHLDLYFRQCSILVTCARPGGDGGDACQWRRQSA